METAQLIESFNQAGQGHVFRFWNELSAADRAQLAAQAAEIDLAEIARLNDTLVRSNTGAAVVLTDLEPAPYVPLPAQTTIAFGEPIRWPELRPADADDPAVVTRCYDEVVRVMQRMLDRLSEGRRPWFGKPCCRR